MKKGCSLLLNGKNGFPSEMSADLLHEIETVLEELDEKMIGVDKQESQLNEVFRRWHSSGKGDSCVVSGERGSGRTTVVTAIWRRFDRAEKNHIYVAQLGSDATAQDAISGDETKPRVIIIEDADELASRQRQTLLYSILDSTRTKPWLVILMVNRQDFITCLEKRVRSRLSTAKVSFKPALRFEEYLDAFEKFLTIESAHCSKGWRKFVSELTKSRSVQKELQFMFAINNSYSLLKTCVAVFLSWLPAACDVASGGISVARAAQEWENAVRTVVPAQNPFPALLNEISLRTFCVFLCVYRRLKDQPSNSYTAYSKVLVDYKNLVNTADNRMAVSEDTLIFKEIDRLIQLGVLFGSHSANNLSFRRVSLHADPFLLKDAVSQRVIPSNIREWFKTIPTN